MLKKRIFLCHASEDKDKVYELYHYLKEQGINAWLDKEDLLPGVNWQDEIPRALRNSEVVIVFLSKSSVSKRGYVKREFKIAYDTLQEIPQGKIFVIPVKLDDCNIPAMFSHLQWIMITEKDAFEKILNSIKQSFSVDNSLEVKQLINPPSVYINTFENNSEYIYIPGGAHTTNGKHNAIIIKPFYFAKFSVTNMLYRRFVKETKCNPPIFPKYIDKGKFTTNDDQPQMCVEWIDATNYCKWLTENSPEKLVFRLPTEAEWEWAAGGGIRSYPWGEEQPDITRANYECLAGRTTPVGHYPLGATPEGLMDMGGNIWEWCSDLHERYRSYTSIHVLRGGSWNYSKDALRCSYRIGGFIRGTVSGSYEGHQGFRVVRCV